MTREDAAPEIHQPLEAQLDVARLELDDIASGLWGAVGYDKDPIAEALSVFPEPSRRRSDTTFECTPEEEAKLRPRAAALGPGREAAESLEDLGIYRVDAEAIEPGQLHKTVTELWRTLIEGSKEGHKAPIVVFASDRVIPLWKKDQDKQDTDEVDAERISSDRLLVIGGQGLAASADFFYRAGTFDADAKAGKEDAKYQETRRDRALALPGTEYDITEAFLGGALDEIADEVMGVGYDPEDGQVHDDPTGQVRRLGRIGGREVFFVHKEPRRDGSALDTTATVLLLGGIASKLTATAETVMSYRTSATYKPSRQMSGIKAGILAAQEGRKLRVPVPTYGYVDLSRIKGDQNPKPPSIQNIAGEMGKAASSAADLRDFLKEAGTPGTS